ncbi:tetratricopeptide repeat protein [Desulfohalovibrio reitneri]|uniref:tetratricopeptide repeat protein n=1 Tax=Desulfohalovibrio reitneri TaxID=1307759 RepID=UPI000550C62A|nr:tetratricopeptide repeat protein [Desulfohalovibrio reitneri]
MQGIQGIFSTTTGTGEAARKVYWTARERDDGSITVQPLSRNFAPSGQPRNVSREDFLERFEPEPEFFLDTVSDRRQGKEVVDGRPLADMDLPGAEQVNEDNIKANFNLGLWLLENGRKAKARRVFERILRLEGPFRREDKHLFNGFGIALRKYGQPDMALSFYDKAHLLARDDENLHHNMARSHFEKGDTKKAREELEKSLRLNPGLKESKRFLRYLSGQGRPKPRVYRQTPFEE